MMVEQFRHPRRFLALARRAHAAGKPIVLLHPGRSAAARMSAKTHTGAMSGDYDVMRALVSHAGVALVDTLEELLDLGELMVRWPSLPRGGAAVISDSGAFKAMVLDFCETSDLDLPEPLGTTKEQSGRARTRSHPADQPARRHRSVAGRSRSLSQGDEAVPRRRALRQLGARRGTEQSDPQRAQDGANHRRAAGLRTAEAGCVRHDGRGQRGCT